MRCWLWHSCPSTGTTLLSDTSLHKCILVKKGLNHMHFHNTILKQTTAQFPVQRAGERPKFQEGNVPAAVSLNHSLRFSDKKSWELLISHNWSFCSIASSVHWHVGATHTHTPSVWQRQTQVYTLPAGSGSGPRCSRCSHKVGTCPASHSWAGSPWC